MIAKAHLPLSYSLTVKEFFRLLLKQPFEKCSISAKAIYNIFKIPGNVAVKATQKKNIYQSS
ncbi:hypothetical protein DU508_03940 [Pedobacter chinensis]|uniref:Uncharacterized protein n=1 Tax=Pedobacter chinensis TaxID=2282421 RepID=A0A369Q4A0_9SPHI|nr:hypothetical protein DU508_03940 [Pedobacter chinensis]